MTDVYWLEQTAADVPTGNDWLSAAERLRLQGMRFAKRRADWRLGRWTAKCALAIVLDLSQEPQSLATIEIRTLPSGAPEVFLDALSSRVSLSLSHCAGRAGCAVALNSVAVGCDLERIEPHSDAFAADYFSTGEQAMVAQSAAAERSRLLTLLWSAKESALKALQVGLRLDTRSVSVSPGSSL